MQCIFTVNMHVIHFDRKRGRSNVALSNVRDPIDNDVAYADEKRG